MRPSTSLVLRHGEGVAAVLLYCGAALSIAALVGCASDESSSSRWRVAEDLGVGDAQQDNTVVGDSSPDASESEDLACNPPPTTVKDLMSVQCRDPRVNAGTLDDDIVCIDGVLHTCTGPQTGPAQTRTLVPTTLECCNRRHPDLEILEPAIEVLSFAPQEPLEEDIVTQCQESPDWLTGNGPMTARVTLTLRNRGNGSAENIWCQVFMGTKVNPFITGVCPPPATRKIPFLGDSFGDFRFPTTADSSTGIPEVLGPGDTVKLAAEFTMNSSACDQFAFLTCGASNEPFAFRQSCGMWDCVDELYQRDPLPCPRQSANEVGLDFIPTGALEGRR